MTSPAPTREQISRRLTWDNRWTVVFGLVTITNVIFAVLAIFVDPRLIVEFLTNGVIAFIGAIMASDSAVCCEDYLRYLDRLDESKHTYR